MCGLGEEAGDVTDQHGTQGPLLEMEAVPGGTIISSTEVNVADAAIQLLEEVHVLCLAPRRDDVLDGNAKRLRGLNQRIQVLHMHQRCDDKSMRCAARGRTGPAESPGSSAVVRLYAPESCVPGSVTCARVRFPMTLHDSRIHAAGDSAAASGSRDNAMGTIWLIFTKARGDHSLNGAG